MFDSCGIYSVIGGMCTKPNNIQSLGFKIEGYDQSKRISLYIKYYPVICYHAGITINLLQFIKILIIGF